jgi:hypothetical protein
VDFRQLAKVRWTLSVVTKQYQYRIYVRAHVNVIGIGISWLTLINVADKKFFSPHLIDSEIGESQGGNIILLYFKVRSMMFPPWAKSTVLSPIGEISGVVLAKVQEVCWQKYSGLSPLAKVILAKILLAKFSNPLTMWN